MKKSYSIHDALDFTIRFSDQYACLGAKYITKQYENFAVSEASDSALKIEMVGPSTRNRLPAGRSCFSVDDTIVWKSGFSTTGSYKQARWHVMVNDLFSQHVVARIVCNLPGYLVITGEVIDQILALQLVARDFSLVHAACVENEHGCHLLAGSSGTGKTSTTLFLMGQGYRFLGDNFAIIKDGAAMSFLSPLNVFSYNLSEPLRQRLSRAELFQLWWRKLLFGLTRGYIKLFTKVNPLRVWPESIGRSAPLHTIIFLVSGARFNVTSIERDEMVDRLLYNMKLELKELDTWMTRYTYVFSGLSEHDLWRNYRGALLRNIPVSVKCLKVELPRRIDPAVSESIHMLLDGSRDVH